MPTPGRASSHFVTPVLLIALACSSEGPASESPGAGGYWAYDNAEIFDTLLTRVDAGDDELDFCAPSRNDIGGAK